MSAATHPLPAPLARAFHSAPLAALVSPWGGRLAESLPLVLASSAFFWGLHYLGYAFACRRLFPGASADASLAKKRRDFAMLCVGFAHAVFACAGSLYVLATRPADYFDDIVYGDPDARLHPLVAVSVGYFLWDAGVCALHRCAPAFWAHAWACLLVFAFALHPVFLPMAPLFLLRELSTPFLNARGVLLLLKRTDTALFKACEQLFGVTFLLSRIAMGVPVSVLWWRAVAPRVAGHFGWYGPEVAASPEYSLHSAGIVCFFMGADVLLTVLNVVWSRKIVRMAVGAPRKPRMRAKGSGSTA